MRCNPFSDGGYDPVERQRLFRQPPAAKVGPEDLETRA
jgi:putative component of membrane protein insertase Oxa1/YidC/SpoIIIJ protein YidD